MIESNQSLDLIASGHVILVLQIACVEPSELSRLQKEVRKVRKQLHSLNQMVSSLNPRCEHRKSFLGTLNGEMQPDPTVCNFVVPALKFLILAVNVIVL